MKDEKNPFISFFVLLGTSQNVEAQWELVEQVDKWGEKNGQRNAVSEVTQSSTNQGYRLFLKVIGGRNECFLAVRSVRDMWLKGSHRTQSSVYHDIQFWMDGEERTVRMQRCCGEEIDMLTPSHRVTEKRLISTWKEVGRLKMILPTEVWGDLLYSFDMTGSRWAIEKACPNPK